MSVRSFSFLLAGVSTSGSASLVVPSLITDPVSFQSSDGATYRRDIRNIPKPVHAGCHVADKHCKIDLLCVVTSTLTTLLMKV